MIRSKLWWALLFIGAFALGWCIVDTIKGANARHQKHITRARFYCKEHGGVYNVYALSPGIDGEVIEYTCMDDFKGEIIISRN